ncbi:hypothetical protein AMTRI_Chr12g241970 [Amborella trichopoda]|uniref:DUF679 domain membrane protein 2 n=1 Tax=Amborella trichopoda TaxID=13333 RepID=W1PC26_AMBTC|nr:uncharacterized protein LOC18435697 [Amborella trichopoda]ERN07477.1 hypothetical protein AMTR_s00019p00255810 [Amborella trichopoda]|eukprot:XP_020523697.1 uncharacterized protein LOC18435697 [Amborella trichopoda]
MADKTASSSSTKKGSGSAPGVMDRTIAGAVNITRLLPTGTVLAFQLLSPLFTNNGYCHPINKYFTGVLLLFCNFSCGFVCFTDSYTGKDGNTYYGVATRTGLWTSSSDPDSSSLDFSTYKVVLGDWVHAGFSILVFAVVALLDPNTVNCYYPSMGTDQKALLMGLPPAVGFLSSIVFALFPNRRHGVGYPAQSSTTSQ